MPADDEETIVDVLPPWDVDGVPSRKIYVDNVSVKIVAQLSPGIDPRFMCHLLASPSVYDQATLSTTGTAQPTIPLRALRNFLVPLPPLNEQHRIAAKVDELMAICDQMETQLTAAETERRRLLEAVLHEALAPPTSAV